MGGGVFYFYLLLLRFYISGISFKGFPRDVLTLNNGGTDIISLMRLLFTIINVTQDTSETYLIVWENGTKQWKLKGNKMFEKRKYNSCIYM